MAVDILFQHPEPVTQHDDLMKKIIDRDLFWFQGFIGGLQQQCSFDPFIARRCAEWLASFHGGVLPRRVR